MLAGRRTALSVDKDGHGTNARLLLEFESESNQLSDSDNVNDCQDRYCDWKRWAYLEQCGSHSASGLKSNTFGILKLFVAKI